MGDDVKSNASAASDAPFAEVVDLQRSRIKWTQAIETLDISDPDYDTKCERIRSKLAVVNDSIAATMKEQQQISAFLNGEPSKSTTSSSSSSSSGSGLVRPPFPTAGMTAKFKLMDPRLPTFLKLFEEFCEVARLWCTEPELRDAYVLHRTLPS